MQLAWVPLLTFEVAVGLACAAGAAGLVCTAVGALPQATRDAARSPPRINDAFAALTIFPPGAQCGWATRIPVEFPAKPASFGWSRAAGTSAAPGPPLSPRPYTSGGRSQYKSCLGSRAYS